MSSIIVVKYQWDWLSPVAATKNYYWEPALDVPIPPPVLGLSANVRVQIHDVPLPSLVRTSYLYYSTETSDVSVVVEQPTNPHFLGRFASPWIKPSLLSSVLYAATGEDIGSQKETNTHFLGRFKVAWLAPSTVSNLYYRAPDTSVPVSDQPNPHFLGRFKSWWLSANLISSRLYVAQGLETSIAQTETNVNFVGRFGSPWIKSALAAALYNFAEASDAPVVAQVETNPHFIGRYRSPTFALLTALRQNFDTVEPNAFAAEAQPHFVSRFSAIVHRVPIALRQNTSFDQTETNTSWLGRFNPTAFKLLAAFRQNEARDIFVAPADDPTNFLGRFRAPAHLRFNYNTWDTGVPVTDQSEFPSFIGKFRATTHVILAGHRQNITSDSTETNPHFVGRFAAPKHGILPGLRQNPALDVFVEQAGRDWIGRFKAQVHTIQIALRQTPNTDFITANVVQEPSFIGRHRPTTFSRFNYNSLDTGVPVRDQANPHFVGRHTAPKPSILAQLRQNEARDIFVTAETNVNFVGRFKAQVHVIQAALRQNEARDVFAVAQPETNPHFLGRFKAPVVSRFLYNTWDTAVPVRAADIPNPHFIGKFSPRTHKLLQQLRQNEARDAQRETNPHFVGRFTPRTHKLLLGLRQNDARDLDSRVETNPHFVGRYVPALHRILYGLRQTVPNDIFIASVPACISADVRPVWIIDADVVPVWMVVPSAQAGYRVESELLGCEL